MKLPSFTLLLEGKGVSYTRVPCRSFRQECPTRARHKTVPARVSRKSVLQDCTTAVPEQSALQQCPTRMSNKCLTRMRQEPQECPTRVSYNSVSRQCPTQDPQECPTQCPTRASTMSRQECPRTVVHKTVPQKCVLEECRLQECPARVSHASV